VQKSGANDRFLVNPTIRWRGQEWLLRIDPGGSIAVPRMPAIGAKASSDLRRAIMPHGTSL